MMDNITKLAQTDPDDVKHISNPEVKEIFVGGKFNADKLLAYMGKCAYHPLGDDETNRSPDQIESAVSPDIFNIHMEAALSQVTNQGQLANNFYQQRFDQVS